MDKILRYILFFVVATALGGLLNESREQLSVPVYADIVLVIFIMFVGYICISAWLMGDE